jgi:hypothetical protein
MTSSETPSESLPESNPLTSFLGPTRRRTGYVARKPKEIRDQINRMLLDGVPYLQIIEALGDNAKDLNEDTMSSWKNGGYQDWLRDQQKIEDQKAKREFAIDLSCDENGHKIHQANLETLATNLCDLLVDLDPVALREMLETDPDKYTRLINAIVRLSDGSLKRDKQLEARLAAQNKLRNDKKGISDGAIKDAESRLKLM